MNRLLYCLCLILGISELRAQRTCATAPFSVAAQTDLNARTSSPNRDTLPDEQITIPVVIHVLYKDGIQNISDAQIQSQIVALNNDFNYLNTDKINAPAAFKNLAADSRIKFCLARVDPKGRATSGIIRKHTNTAAFLVNDDMKFSSAGGDDAWDSKRYLNIWVCNLLGRNLGYATFPGGEAERDGVVIQYTAFGTVGTLMSPYNKGRTTTHETGHWLGLKHIWGDDVCGNDGIADTPPQKTYSNGCPTFPQMSTCSVNSNGDMFMNYMDFTDDACMNMFSVGQKKKMRSLFASNGLRNSFLNSMACDSSLADDGPLPIESTISELQISVYPNPVVTLLTVEIKNAPANGKRLKLYNVNGLLVMDVVLVQQTTRLDLKKLPAGIYLVKVSEGKESWSRKIIKL